MSEDPEVHFRYIEAAVKVGNMGEVERMTHDSNLYDPERTKEFLKEARLNNMWPLINVCDKHGYIPELVEYLYNNGQLKYVDAYVQQRSPQNAPQVVGLNAHVFSLCICMLFALRLFMRVFVSSHGDHFPK